MLTFFFTLLTYLKSIGNVAAGSHDFGFWLERMIRGLSQDLDINAGINPQTLPLGTFDGNVAHSNIGNGVVAFYPDAYRPTVPGVVKNIYSYKNGGNGIRRAGTLNIILDGGVIR